MKTRASSILLGLTSCSILILASCENKESAAPTTTSVEPKHPWDITPDTADMQTGKVVYLKECASCHNEGEEGAPSLLDKEEWSIREAKGINILIDHALNGFIGEDGEMPARGGSDLSDEEVKTAVSFMLKVTNLPHN